MATIDSTPVSLVSGADLSARKNRFGKVDNTGRVVACSVAGERADLVIGSEPDAAGKGVDAFIERVMKVEAGGSFDAGADLTTDSVGRAIVAGAGQHVNAVALGAGATGRLVSVLRPLVQPHAAASSVAVAAAGAIPPSASHIALTVADTKAYTLDDGELGHEIEIDCVAVSGTPLGTVTLNGALGPAGTESATHVFTAAGQSLRLRMHATGWKVVGKRRAGARTVVVGTDVLTGHDMVARYNLSVTGTVTGAAAGGVNIPNGQVDGEFIDVQVTVAGGTPDGEIDITAETLDGAAATKIDDINGTTAHHMQLRWNGAAWQQVTATGLALA